MLYSENMQKAKRVQTQVSTVFAGWPNPADHPSCKHVSTAPCLTCLVLSKPLLQLILSGTPATEASCPGGGAIAAEKIKPAQEKQRETKLGRVEAQYPQVTFCMKNLFVACF